MRVVRNRYPVLTPDGAGGASGDAEVVVLSPRHDDRFEDLSVAHLAGALEVIWERAAALSSRFASVLIYINEGFGAGASMSHLHAQLIALDFASPQLERELAETDGHDDPVRADLSLARDEDLLVHDGEIASWAPWASPFTSMVRFASREPVEFTSVSPRQLELLATELQEVVRAMQRTLNLGAYNVLFHLRPTAEGSIGSWRVEVVPRRVMFGGFELMSGMIAQDRDPLDTARTLREALRS
jgi:UDPglucose--hexose-1-phosphate uridylyltransferase